jgi:DNA processing protein
MDNLPYLLALHSIYGLGNVRLSRLLEYYQDPINIWNASSKELLSLQIPDSVINEVSKLKKEVDPEKYLKSLLEQKINIVTIFDKGYPKGLTQIDNPPLIIYYRGSFSAKDKDAFAVVGSRKVSGYGRVVTEKLTDGLIDYGLTIVSGLAQGVDTIAHQTAINRGSRTIAVLGGGINIIFPPQNKRLAQDISGGLGVVLSEYPPNAPHLAGNFPQRNRIVAALSKGVLVTEAALASGSLITARLSLEQGKDVFAVPGPINSYLSEGTNNLIKSGAVCTTSVEDITNYLGLEKSHLTLGNKALKLIGLEQEIFNLLSSESKHIDEITQILRKDISHVNSCLIKMELNGFIINLGNNYYSKPFS